MPSEIHMESCRLSVHEQDSMLLAWLVTGNLHDEHGNHCCTHASVVVSKKMSTATASWVWGDELRKPTRDSGIRELSHPLDMQFLQKPTIQQQSSVHVIQVNWLGFIVAALTSAVEACQKENGCEAGVVGLLSKNAS